MRAFVLLLALIVLTQLSGCATLTQDGMQTVMLEAYTKDNQSVNARCVASNNHGQWIAYAPGKLEVHRSGGDLKILCEREKGDAEAGQAVSVSRANDAAKGNLLMVGSALWALIDHATGYGYSYPVTLRIVMGENQHFDARSTPQNDRPATQPSPNMAATTLAKFP